MHEVKHVPIYMLCNAWTNDMRELETRQFPMADFDGSVEFEDVDEHNEASKPQHTTSRNKMEKKRRDRFNVLLNRLAQDIYTAGPVDKLNKASILRDVVNYFRDHSVANATDLSWHPPFVSKGEFGKIMLDSLDCFVLVLDRAGRIFYASDDVLPCIGFIPAQLVGKNFFDLIHDGDKQTVYLQLIRQQQHQRRRSSLDDQNDRTNSSDVSFSCNVCSGAHKATAGFQLIHCFGQVCNQNHPCLIMLMKLDSSGPNKILCSADSVPEVFTTRLSLEWKYTFIDHVATLVTGYFPCEVIGKTEYELCHPDDLNKLLEYHELLLHAGKVTTCYYRLLTKGQTWIWVRTSCGICYSQWNSKPECVTCITSAVSYTEVCLRQKQVLKNDKQKFKRFRERLSNKRGSTRKADKKASSESSKECTPTESANEAKVPRDVRSVAGVSWPENLKLPPGLTNTQMLIHLQLQEQYTRLSKQMQRHVGEMKRIRRQIECQKVGDLKEQVEKDVWSQKAQQQQQHQLHVKQSQQEQQWQQQQQEMQQQQQQQEMQQQQQQQRLILQQLQQQLQEMQQQQRHQQQLLGQKEEQRQQLQTQQHPQEQHHRRQQEQQQQQLMLLLRDQQQQQQQQQPVLLQQQYWEQQQQESQQQLLQQQQLEMQQQQQQTQKQQQPGRREQLSQPVPLQYPKQEQRQQSSFLFLPQRKAEEPEKGQGQAQRKQQVSQVHCPGQQLCSISSFPEDGPARSEILMKVEMYSAGTPPPQQCGGSSFQLPLPLEETRLLDYPVENLHPLLDSNISELNTADQIVRDDFQETAPIHVDNILLSYPFDTNNDWC